MYPDVSGPPSSELVAHIRRHICSNPTSCSNHELVAHICRHVCMHAFTRRRSSSYFFCSLFAVVCTSSEARLCPSCPYQPWPCIHTCMYVCLYAPSAPVSHACMCICTPYLPMAALTLHTCVDVRAFEFSCPRYCCTHTKHRTTHICMACIYVCTYIYIYIYIHTHTH